MDDNDKNKVLELYPEFNKLYGPYLQKDGRKRVVLFDGERRSSRLLAKVLLEVKLGRRLTPEETVDHRDEDASNDDPDNLQSLTQSDNAAKGYRANHQFVRSDEDQICSICSAGFRNVKVRQTCGSSDCKSKNRSRISKELGLIPPKYRGAGK